VPSLDGRTVHNIKKSFILDIIQPRMEELLEYVRRSVEQSGYKDYPLLGVLTGGGSQLKGVSGHCLNILGLKEVRLGGVQRDLLTANEEFFDPKYSTAMALALYACQENGYEDFQREGYENNASLFGKIGKVFKNFNLFGG